MEWGWGWSGVGVEVEWSEVTEEVIRKRQIGKDVG